MEQAEHADAAGRSHVDLAIGNHGYDILIAHSELIPPTGSLVRVVQLGSQIVSVVGVENRWIAVLGRPQDHVFLRATGDAWSRTRKRKGSAGLRLRSSAQLGIAIESQCPNPVARGTVIDPVAEESGS